MSDLPPGWAEERLGDIAVARMGKTILSKELLSDGLPVYSAGVSEGPWGYIETSDVVFQPPTIVISARGTIGSIRAPNDPEFVSTQTTIALTPTPAVDRDYLVYLLGEVEWADSTATTAIPMLTITALDKVLLPLAPRAEQRRIVAKIDALTARSKRARAELQRVRELAVTARSAALDSAFSTIAAPYAALSSVCLSISDGDHQAPPRSTTGVPFLTISALVGGEPKVIAASRWVPIAYERQLDPKRRPALGDVLLSVTGSLGVVARVRSPEPFVFQRHIAILKPSSDRIDSDYVFHALTSPSLQQNLIEHATGTAQLTIPLSALRAAEVPLPPLPEQRAIVARIEAAFARIDAVAREAERAAALLDRLDQAILARAFRGELVPQDPADEPASTLLARLTATRETASTPKRGRRA